MLSYIVYSDVKILKIETNSEILYIKLYNLKKLAAKQTNRK